MKTEKEIAASDNVNSKSEYNKHLVRRAVEEIWNQGNYDNLEQFVTRDLLVHLSPDEKLHGIEGVKLFYSELRQAFPDIRFVVEDQVAESDRVVTHWTAEGTHRGEFKGISATGRRMSLTGIDIDRIVDGKVAECWAKTDELGLLRQLGMKPAADSV